MRFYQSAWFERWWPLACAALVFALLTSVIHLQISDQAAVRDLLSASVSIGGIAVGFLATIKAILYTISDAKIIKAFKDTNLYLPFIRYIMRSIHACFAFSCYSAAGLLFYHLHSDIWYSRGLESLWFSLAVYALASSYRVIMTFSSILQTMKFE